MTRTEALSIIRSYYRDWWAVGEDADARDAIESRYLYARATLGLARQSRAQLASDTYRLRHAR